MKLKMADNQTVRDASKSASSEINNYPSWAPRFWHGMRVGVWWRLLIRNRFRISLSRLHIALGVSFFGWINEFATLHQWLVYRGRIRDAKISTPPVFIVGHWRSGTTLLHELLATDQQFASPTTFQCLAPSHHLASEWFFVRFGGFLLPEKRPMDNMSAGWLKPQEDEFALMNLGAKTPYTRIAFPQSEERQFEYFNFRSLSASAKQQWLDTFQWFLRTLVVRYPGKRLVLKSPPHTGRIAFLAEAFPGAKFIHLTRDPRKLFPSTRRLWKSLDAVQALQTEGPEEDQQQYVIRCMQEMYEHFEEDVQSLPEGTYTSLSYEELVDQPEVVIERLYSQLDLGDFHAMQPALKERLADHENYQVNQHKVDQDLEQIIQTHWSKYVEMFGYES
ncbi:MAG TPA: sulfotransferase [Planctomycetaceae bacterium]|nr:sulfotransferase [Planctomycetaceae bacterium]